MSTEAIIIITAITIAKSNMILKLPLFITLHLLVRHLIFDVFLSSIKNIISNSSNTTAITTTAINTIKSTKYYDSYNITAFPILKDAFSSIPKAIVTKKIINFSFPSNSLANYVSKL